MDERPGRARCLFLASAVAVTASAACGRGASSGLGPESGKLPWHVRGIWLQGETHTHYLLRRDPGAAMIEAAVASGLDFIASTNHAQAAFTNHPSRTIEAMRREYPGILILAGIEWNVPAGDHATVLVEQGPGEWELLQRFSQRFDRKANPQLKALEVEESVEDGGGTWAISTWPHQAPIELAAHRRRAERPVHGVYLNHLARHDYLSVADIDELQRAGLAGFEAAPGQTDRAPRTSPRSIATIPSSPRPAAATPGSLARLLSISAGSDFHKDEIQSPWHFFRERSSTRPSARGGRDRGAGGLRHGDRSGRHRHRGRDSSVGAGAADGALIGESLARPRGARASSTA